MLELERSVTHYHLLRQSRVRFFGLRPHPAPSFIRFHASSPAGGELVGRGYWRAQVRSATGRGNIRAMGCINLM